ncbi:MAG: STAS domain-containing protein [Candidatus Omnitrophica bacterium]|nr:STAS domain-containing protein [Candidatus Omnitrophota bacterium]
MKIHQRQDKGVQIYEVEGEINFHNSPDLRDRLHEAIARREQKILIQLRKVSYIDSSGLATFVEALQKTKKYQGHLVLTELMPAVKSVFEIAKLDGIFSLAGSLESGLNLLRSPG